ncbi:hypothetical protein [Intestinimonas sp.]|uniref:hypothetical protein n=1 Tax=Intestinimonas sp. TaxID=1965293 RepID=UPI0026290D8B|nr:hypothetical protein [Intestinimonas sp.]
MEQEFYLPVLSHFENDNGWSGSRGLLCYEIEKPKEGTLRVVIWQGPFCRQYARQEGEETFPVSQAGIDAMRAWLLAQADAMNAHPHRTAAECRAYYEERTRQSEKTEE